MSKRFLSLFMTLMLCFSMLQPTAFAEDAETETVTMQEQEEQQEQEEREEQEEQEPPDAAAEPETQEPDAPSDEAEPQSGESLPSLQSNEENEIALQSAYDVASVGGTNYTTLESAFAAAAAQGGGTIKLLKNATLDTNIKWQVDANVTLDTNGYSITADYASYTDKMYLYYTAPDITIESGKLTLVNSAATSEKLYIKFCIRYGNTLEVTPGATKSIYYIDIADTDSKLICTTGTISELSLIHQQGFDVTLADDKGNYCTIADKIHTFSTNDKVEELLGNHPGCALYSDEGKIKCGNTIRFLEGKNFRVAKCDEHDRGSAFSSTKCQYCGTDMLSGLAAENVSKGWYHETFSEALSNASAGNTIKLRKNIADDFTVDKDITINPNYYNINAAVTVNSGKTLTLDGAGTIKTVQVNGALDIQHDALTVKELTFAGAPTPTTNLSYGEFGKFDVSKTGRKAYEFLAEGYAFARTADGNVVNGYVDKLTDVKIVSHSHDMSTGACACGLSCSHPNGFDDNDQCPDCGAHLAASVYNQSQDSTTKYFNLQDAIDSMNDTNIFDITLLDDANGSYTVTKSHATRFVMNDKTINEITISGNSSVAFNTVSNVVVTINKVTFCGKNAFFNAPTPYIKIGKLTVADGATWSSILPNETYGYNVSDGTTKKWYDMNTAGDMQSMDNVIVTQLPVKSNPQLKIGGTDMADETTVIFSKPIELAFTATVHNYRGGDGNLYIQKEGDLAPTPFVADGKDGSYTYTIPAGELQPAVYKIWAEVSKEGYTRTSKKHTLNVVEKLVPTGNPILSNNGTITYGEKVGSISLTGDMYDSSYNTAVEGTFAWADKDANVTPDAGIYEAEWIFTPKDKTTYSSTTGTARITVNKADIPDSAITTVPTAIAELEYKHGDNTPQVLHTEGTVAAGYGTIKYTAANPETAAESDWQDTPISMVDAGDYAIYYKVFGDSNHNDSKSYKIEDCHIEKYGLFYTIICKAKPYDGTTDAEVESVKFQVSGNANSEEIKLNDGVDYEIKNLKYKSPDPNGYLGLDRVYATCDITLKDTPAAHNYKLAGNLIYGYIRTIKFTDFEAHDYEFELRYNDMTGKRFGATAFGAPNDEDYEISSDGVAHEGSSPEMFKPAKISRSLNSDGTCTFYIIDQPLDESYIGKVFVEKMRLCSKDNKYANHPDGEQTLSVIIRIVDKATPVISPDDITIAAIYDGQPLTAERIGMYANATYSGANVDGTWSWKDGKAPTNVGDNGKYTIVFTPTDTEAYKPAEKEVDVRIEPCRTEPTTAELSQTAYDYDGNEKKPSATVIVNGKNLTEDEDYEIAYTDNKNAGTATAVITGKGNYGFAAMEKQFVINKANVKVKPKNISKTYGSEPKYALEESDSNLITAEELANLAANATFTSDGAEATGPVGEYEITVSLAQNELDNLTLSVGTGKLTVKKAPLTVTVNDVSREYGAPNPELSVTYEGFVNGEDESVLDDELILVYENIDETTSVGPHPGAAKASGLTAKNYEITYKPGNVTITKIPVSASGGAARSSYLSVVLDKAVEGLTAANFTVSDSEGNAIAVTNVTVSSDGKTYTLGGVFDVGKEYTVKIVLSGVTADETHEIIDEIKITPARSGSGGSSKYTVSFETDGGSKVSKQTVAKNTTAKEPTAPTKEGFDFAGWYTDKELKEKYDFSAKVTKNITLYAAWTEKDDSINRIILTVGEKSAQVFGQTKTNDVAPKIVNDRTMLPARFVAENLGANVSWDGEKELVTVSGKNLKTNEDITILIYIGSDIAYVNGKEIKLDCAAFVENDRTYTPVRFISEELGASVEWVEDEQKVVITK